MILVTGGAGVMGSRLVRRLSLGGTRVRALVLPGDPTVRRLAGCPCEVVEGDITDRGGLEPAMRGVGTVFHLAAVIVSRDPRRFTRINVEGTRHVVDAAAAAGVEHLVYVSSASVTYPRLTDYGRSKLEAERIVRECPVLRSTVVRPTLVYDRSGGQEIEMLARLLRALPCVPFVAGHHAVKRPVFAPDIVEGLARIAGTRATYGKTYNFSGAEAIPLIDLARLIARQLRVRPAVLPVPAPAWRAAVWLLWPFVRSRTFVRQALAGFTEDADLDNAEARRDIGYDPVPVSVGLPRYFHRRG